MIDAGNFLEHLRWSARFARERQGEHCRDYYSMLRDTALMRFRCNERILALREAVCLFRICTNATRHPKADWQSRLDAGLSPIIECLGSKLPSRNSCLESPNPEYSLSPKGADRKS